MERDTPVDVDGTTVELNNVAASGSKGLTHTAHEHRLRVKMKCLDKDGETQPAFCAYRPNRDTNSGQSSLREDQGSANGIVHHAFTPAEGG